MGNNIIYHYTSPEGLKSILENHSLRFTDYKFLNDKKEGMLASETNCVEKVIEDFCKTKEKNGREYTFLKKVQNLMKIQKNLDDKIFEKDSAGNVEEKKYDYYVFSLSKEKDSLPMWNYYVKNKKYEGYNIGLDIDCLKMFITNNINDTCKIYQEDIIYDFYKIKDSIIESLNKYLSICHKTRTMYDCANELTRKYIFFKNSCFNHEKEYRFVLQEKENRNKKRNLFKYAFFIKNGVFVPFVDMCLGQNMGKFIKSITIAPLIEKDIAKKGLEQFLINNGYEIYNEQTKNGIKIDISNCPIRY